MSTSATPVVPTVVLTINSAAGPSFLAWNEGNEIIETVETTAAGDPDWTEGGPADPRGNDGYAALVTAMQNAEVNAAQLGIALVRLPA